VRTAAIKNPSLFLYGISETNIAGKFKHKRGIDHMAGSLNCMNFYEM